MQDGQSKLANLSMPCKGIEPTSLSSEGTGAQPSMHGDFYMDTYCSGALMSSFSTIFVAIKNIRVYLVLVAQSVTQASCGGNEGG